MHLNLKSDVSLHFEIFNFADEGYLQKNVALRGRFNIQKNLMLYFCFLEEKK